MIKTSFERGLILHCAKAPDQNRTDTRSLEGYCSTIELQARKCIPLCSVAYFLASLIVSLQLLHCVRKNDRAYMKKNQGGGVLKFLLFQYAQA